MNENENEKIIPYPKKKNFNIGIIIFGIIFIYLVGTIIMYITAPKVSVYEVRQGSILKDNAYTGLAIRDEVVVYSEANGYANYFAEENSKVKVGNKIYTLSSNTLDLDSSDTNSEVELTAKEQKQFYSKIQAYNEQFTEDSFSSTYQFKNDIQHSLNKIASQSKSEQLEAYLSNDAHNNLTVYSSNTDGIILYYIDGLEGLSAESITKEHLSKKGYKKNEFTSNMKVSLGEPVYKVIRNESWNLLVQVNEDTKETLLQKKNVKVNFKKDNEELRANFSFVGDESSNILCLSFQDSMIRYASERYLDIELILEDESGLKIPKTAETSKQFYIVPNSYLTQGGNTSSDGVMRKRKTPDGETITEFMNVNVYNEEEGMIYLDPNVFEKGDVLVKPESLETYELSEKRSLKGVYCINKGYAAFKQIKILCESDDYYIVEEGNDFGLSNYDHIALDSKSINENDVVF